MKLPMNTIQNPSLDLVCPPCIAVVCQVFPGPHTDPHKELSSSNAGDYTEPFLLLLEEGIASQKH